MSEHISDVRRRLLRVAASTFAATRLGLVGSLASQLSCAAYRSSAGKLPSLDNATAWLNSPALSSPGLLGKVVVVQFWTYTCINWLRTMPYIRAWGERYERHGLVTVGVHSPEFAFEADTDNVRRAAASLNVGYPIAVDSNHAIWRAFSNHYWPALYIADAQGRVRHHQFGESGYEQSEVVLRQLLSEKGNPSIGSAVVSANGHGVEAAADWGNLKSPESYLGYSRANNFVPSSEYTIHERHSFTLPSRLKLNRWSLSGDWSVQREAVLLNAPNGRIVYRFHARDVHLVMGPAVRDSAVRFRVRIDGQPPGSACGTDITSDGNGLLNEPRMYQLIRQTNIITERQFEIEFLDAAVEAYAFTFG
ncbi:MAG: redoxin domain-containing protein [Phycisphaerae bacterium]|nr:redoxin domain-containing protein [Gemmatimonadaceae bacterium]